jgi:hypothetical protein
MQIMTHIKLANYDAYEASEAHTEVKLVNHLKLTKHMKRMIILISF